MIEFSIVKTANFMAFQTQMEDRLNEGWYSVFYAYERPDYIAYLSREVESAPKSEEVKREPLPRARKRDSERSLADEPITKSTNGAKFNTPLNGKAKAPLGRPDAPKAPLQEVDTGIDAKAPARAPEAQEATPERKWASGDLYHRVGDLFNAHKHFMNFMKTAPDMSSYELPVAEAAIRFGRSYAGKVAPSIFADDATYDRFLQTASDMGFASEESIWQALQNCADYELETIRAWQGDKYTAYAALIAYMVYYDVNQCDVKEQPAVVKALVELVCTHGTSEGYTREPEDALEALAERRDEFSDVPNAVDYQDIEF